MNISNQNSTPASDKMGGFPGKKIKKESMMDALMKLGDVPIQGSKKGKALFSLTENKKREMAEVQAPILGQMKTERKTEAKSVIKHESKQEAKIEGFADKKTSKKEEVLHQKDERESLRVVETNTQNSGFIFAPTQLPTPKISVERKEGSSLLVNPTFSGMDLSRQSGKMPLSMTDIKQEQQIQILRGLAKQLSDPNTPTKQEAFSLPEQGEKVKTTRIQLTLEAPVKASDLKKTNVTVPQSVVVEVKDGKKMKETDGLKVEGVLMESKVEATFRNAPNKVEGIRDIRSLITQEVEQYVEFKEVNSKKVTLSIQHEDMGNMDIQIEKKDNKIFIHLRVDEVTSKERMEHTLEQLKNELKEKEIDVEYEVEQEGEQKEKRKEQQELTEKEKKRENQSDEHHHAKFDELLEVSP